MFISSFIVCYPFESYTIWLFPCTKLTESRVLRRLTRGRLYVELLRQCIGIWPLCMRSLSSLGENTYIVFPLPVFRRLAAGFLKHPIGKHENPIGNLS